MIVSALSVCATFVALAALIAVWTEPPDSVRDFVTVTALVVTVALATVIKTPVRIRSTTVAFAWVETAIVIGLAVAPASWLIVATGIGVACGSVTRLAPIKTAFGVAKHTLVAGGSTLVILLLGNAWPPREPLQIVLLLGVVYLVAAVLGVVKTMGSIDEPPSVLGGMIGSALVGTFLGVLLAYGVVGPIATRLKQIIEQDEQIFHAVKQVIIASLHGHPQPLVVESARSGLGEEVRPRLTELLDALRGR